jgi:hypothetical protein
VDYAITRNKGAILDLDIPGEECASSNNSVVADLTVMSNMGVMHEEIVVANTRCTPFLCATMNLTVFTNDIAGTDL